MGLWQLPGLGTRCLSHEDTAATSVPSQPAALLLHPESSQVLFVLNFSCDGNFALVIVPKIKGSTVPCVHNGCSRFHVFLVLLRVSDNMREIVFPSGKWGRAISLPP